MSWEFGSVPTSPPCTQALSTENTQALADEPEGGKQDLTHDAGRTFMQS